MALWGQGDPRWIVEERPDTHNVNNWHWTEKDATSWSKDEIKSALTDLKYEGEQGTWKIKEISKIEGEATANNRKGKLIFFYDWVIKMEWSGNLKNDDTVWKGYIEVNNLGEENEVDEIDIMVTCKGTESYEMKDLVRKTGIPLVRDACGKYINKLKKEFAQGMILPSKNGNEKLQEKTKTTFVSKNTLNTETKLAPPSKGIGVKVTKVELELEEQFKASVEDLFHVLIEEQRICAFTRARADVDPRPGGKFSILDGNISGEFVELVPEKKIVQKWKFKDWPSGVYSVVTMELSEKEDFTVLKLKQTGIPDNDFQRTEEGWKRHYFESIKHTFGFGARLF